MFLPDDPSAVSGQYTDGTPGGAHGTSIRADHMNAITNEIANVVAGAGLALAKAQSDQLLQAIAELGTVAGTQVAFRNLQPSLNAPGNRFLAFCENDNGRLLAVGENRIIYTSDDGGVTWTSRTAAPPYTGDLTCCTFGNGLFVVAGTTGEIQTSPDGITWSATPSAGSSYVGTFRAVVYSEITHLFTVFGDAGEIQTSATGGGTYVRRKTGGAGFYSAVASATPVTGSEWILGLDSDGKIWRANPLTPATWTQVFDSTFALTNLVAMPRWEWEGATGYDCTLLYCGTETSTFYLSSDLGLTWVAHVDVSEPYVVAALANQTWLGLLYDDSEGTLLLGVHARDLTKGRWAQVGTLVAVTGNDAVEEPLFYVTQHFTRPNRLILSSFAGGENFGVWVSLFAPG